MAQTNEQKAYIDGMKEALRLLEETEKQYYTIKGEPVRLSMAKQEAIVALRGYREALAAEIEAQAPAAKKKAKKDAEPTA